MVKSPLQWKHSHPPEMDDEQFSLWQTAIEVRTGMQIPEQRRTFLKTSIRTRMKEIHCDSFQSYYEQLQTGPSSEQEWTILTDRLTVQETHFFRHQPSFDLAKEKTKEWFTKDPNKKSVQAWSVGCSTGEEPYSLGITLDEQIHSMHLGNDHYFGITATDISMPALNKAQAGIYKEKKITRQISEARQKKYFDQQNDHNFQVKPLLKERVCFARINVLDLSASPLNDLDIIFCQNMLIYFSRWRRREIVNHLASRLQVGGIIILGLGEVMDWANPKLERVPSDKVLAFMRHCH
ncbi:MAG: protein-glutamate O-methyltransferase CheR [Pseudomonadales bacterium]|nr:protein-glutamate O-methyltransferase CheR [Pseudomonadales bacterium]